MIPYTFQDGTHVAWGDWACVPQRALMRDSTVYPNATSFDGYRFLSSSGQSFTHPEAKKLTDLDPFFLVWGLGKQAW